MEERLLRVVEPLYRHGPEHDEAVMLIGRITGAAIRHFLAKERLSRIYQLALFDGDVREDLVTRRLSDYERTLSWECQTVQRLLSSAHFPSNGSTGVSTRHGPEIRSKVFPVHSRFLVCSNYSV
jgi:hypothetical protein